MTNNASSFINNRSNKTSLIDNRINHILNYITICYMNIINEGRIYDYSKRGKISQENFLRNSLVDDYLRKNIIILNSGTEEYTIINKEATETYTDINDNEIHDDPIDIQINDTGLQKAWNSEYQLYYSIECKRIKKISDTNHYINDIKKFTERKYKNIRLPFEGQLAFLEHSSINHKIVSDVINEKLSNFSSITTNSHLIKTSINSFFDGAYISNHCKSFDSKESFKIYHLMLDYSQIIQH